MLKRLKNLWNLSNANQEVVDKAIKAIQENQEMMNHPMKVVGDGKAVFLGQGTEEEWIDQQREDDGTKPWYERIKNL